MAAAGWMMNLGFAGGAGTGEHIVTIDGQGLVADQEGVKMDVQRTVRATLIAGDKAVSYVFNELD